MTGAPITPESALQQAIAFDPDDLSTYLSLLSTCQRFEDHDLYRHTLSKTLQRFPDNRDLLRQAIASSQEKKAFKQAAGHAKKLLQLDPINTLARKSLVNCHLEHARKQIIKKRADLALKEIAAARQQACDSDDHLDITAVTAWLEHLQGNREGSVQAIDLVRRQSLHPLLAETILFTEGQRLKIRDAVIKKILGPQKTSLLPAGRVLQAYCARLRDYQKAGIAKVGDIAKRHGELILRSEESFVDKADHTLLCDCLHAIASFALLQHCAALALKKFPADPLFAFYEIHAAIGGNPSYLRQSQLDRLHALARREDLASYPRADALIHKFMREVDTMFGPPPGWGDDHDDDDGNFQPSKDALFDMLNDLMRRHTRPRR